MIRGAWVQDVQMILPLGSVVQDRYRVEALLGKGGFGAVYLVKDLRSRGNLYALKEMVDSNKKERERFRFECEVIKRLDHSALPRVYHTFEDERSYRAYMLMDHVDGPNLEKLRKRQRGKRFSFSEVMRVMAPVVDAVSYLHRQRPPIVHRDIKPANIIVPEDGGEAVLVDFGIAKEYDQEATTTAIRRCSPGYGAPEQYAKGTNQSTDIYGLGATFYVLLTGQVPLDALYRMTRMGNREEDPLEPANRLNPKIPEQAANAIQKAMQINSNDRFASVEEFWQALQAKSVDKGVFAIPMASDFVPVDEIPTEMVASAGQGQARRRSNLFLLFASLALLALLSGLIFGSSMLLLRNNPGSPTSTQVSGVPSASQATEPAQGTSTSVAGAPGVTATSEVSATATSATEPPSPGASASTSPTATVTTSPPVAAPPKLVGQYGGSLTNQLVTPTVTNSMTLSDVQQNGTEITGYFDVGPVLTGDGNFNGTVTNDRKVQFLVNSSHPHPPLFFEGEVSPDGKSMSGTYCSYVDGKCNLEAGGHGTWQVTA